MKKANNFQVLARLFGLVKPLWWVMLLAILLGTLGNLAAIFLTVTAAWGALKIIAGHFSQMLLGAVLICGLIRGPLHYGEHYCNHLIAFKLLAIIRVKVFQALRRLSPAKLEGKDKGDLISLITSDIELLEVYYAHTVSPIAIAALTTIVMTGFIAHQSLIAGIWALLGYCIVGILIPLINGRYTGKPGREVREQLGAMSTYVLDSMYGIEESLQYDQGPKRLAEMNQRSVSLAKSQKQLARLGSWQGLATNLAVLVFSVGMLGIMAVEFNIGRASLRQFVLATVAMMSSFGPVAALSALSTTLAQTIAAARRVLALLDEEPLVTEKTTGSVPAFSGAAMREVTFAYPGGKRVLQDFNFAIKPGEIVGIHAPSGSGKSTILKLLARFYDADSGQVLLSGDDIRQLQTKGLRAMESYLAQETWLAHDTIANNIRLGHPDTTLAEVEMAAEKASIADFIHTLPKGYDTKLSELETGLSDGQKQRIGIARAFLHAGQFMLLDEITANLDALNEGIILKSLKEAAKDKTIIIVSHRQSTLAIADRVLELQPLSAS
ncbi:amino acid ABC transporter ATP-binding/permease protein [Lactobacillus porci]|uniref:amino acid ABC transporter ATP-binding/permease protein n=1 Tax=Lactobacillus porci TaxID=2012477 RepID=UPI00399110D5